MSDTNNLKPVTKVAIVLVIGLLALGLGAQLIQPVRAVTLVADFSASPSPALPGALVTFTSTFSGGTAPFSFAWNFNDTTSATGNPATHSFTLPAPPAPHDFNVSLTVTDSSAPPQVVKVAHIITITNLLIGINCGLGSTVAVTNPVSGQNPPLTGSRSLDTACVWNGDADGPTQPDGVPPNPNPAPCPGLGCTSEPLVSDLPESPQYTGIIPNYGGGFNVEVRLLNLNATLGGPDKIDGFDVTVAFNPHLLSAVKFDENGLVFDPNHPPPGSGGISQLATVIDNNIGTARLAQTILGVSTGGDDLGGITLFRIRFDVVGVGVSPLTVQADQVTRPSIVPHVTQSASFDSEAFYDPTATLGWSVFWSFSPSPEIPGSPITFTATGTCTGCVLPLVFRWDFGSRNNGVFDAMGATVTIPTPPTGFAISRVILNVTDSNTAGPLNEVAAVRRLPLVVAPATGPATLARGTAGTFAESWLGGITPYSANWRLCPGSTTPVETRVCNFPNPSTGGIAQSSSVSNTYNFAGVYTNTITVKDTAAGGYAGGLVSQTLVTSVTGTPVAYSVTTFSNSTNAPVNTPVKISARMAYDSTYPAYSKAADTVVNGTAPAVGTSLKTDANIRFCDTLVSGGACVTNGNKVWDPTEWVFYSTTTTISGSSIVLYQGAGTRPITGSLTSESPNHFRFIGAGTLWVSGNVVTYDVNVNNIFDASFQAIFNFGDGSATVTVNGAFTINATHTYTAAATYTVGVTVAEFSVTAPSKIGETGTLSQVIVPPVTFDYSLSVAPTTVNLVQGTTSSASTVSALLVSGTSQAVTLSISGLPTGVTASAFIPNPVTPASPAATSTFTLTATASAPVVSGVTVTITGTSTGGVVRTTTFTLNVVASFDYSLSVAPTTVNLVQGTTSAASSVSALLVAGTSQAVTLSISGLPTGVTASAFTPNPVSPASPAATSTFTLTAASTATVVSGVTVTITGTSTGGVVRTTTFTLNVVAAFDYSLSVAPTTVNLVQGTTSAASTVSALLVSGTSQAVTLSISGLPTGVTASAFTPNPVTPASPAATSTFTLTAAATAPVVSGVTVTITGTSTGGVVRTTTFTLNVLAAFNYSLSVAPTTVNLVQGTTSSASTVSALPALLRLLPCRFLVCLLV